VPTSSEELGHIRPGHFWLCELGEAGGGSPIMQTFEKREFKYGTRFDKDDCAILLRRYLNRTAEDSLGLTFVEWEEAAGKTLVVNSCELRKVGHFLEQIGGPVGQPQRAHSQRNGAQVVSRPAVALRSDPRNRYAISAVDDARIRVLCENS